MVVTGMRVGELCKLQCRYDLSPDCSVVRIHCKGARERVAYITDAGTYAGDLKRHRRAAPHIAAGACGALFVNRHPG